MRVLRCAWPLAGVLLVSLASAEMASADDRDESTTAAVSAKATAPETGSTFRLLGKTWCLGAQPVATACDVTLPERPAAEPASSERPLDRFFAAVRRMLSASPAATATGPAEKSATSGG